MNRFRSWVGHTVAVVVLLFHLGGAALWWTLMPHGFPVGHPRFWLNEAAPALVGIAVFSSLVGLAWQRASRLRWVLVSFPCFWIAASLVARFLFPLSLSTSFAIPLVLAMAAAFALPSLIPKAGASNMLPISAIASGLALGSNVAWSLRAPLPDTHPANVPFRAGPTSKITLHASALTLEIDPLLEFESISPDRSWSLLSPFAPPTLSGLVVTDRQGSNVRIEGMSLVEGAIYSHLNSFSQLAVSGHKRLAIAFSPCPDMPIEVHPMDYPAGRPERFAYLDRSDLFHVAEATSGEKGPFSDLAVGKLEDRGSLGVTLYDEGRPIFRITFDDWASQASTSLSPTAGWGVPENAIEFFLRDDLPSSSAFITLTLAGTSVGRGWDTVGHVAGTYRNRIRVDSLVP